MHKFQISCIIKKDISATKWHCCPFFQCCKKPIMEGREKRQDIKSTTFFLFLSSLAERLDTPCYESFKSQLDSLPDDPAAVKRLGLDLISLACISHTKEIYISFCKSVDSYFSGTSTGDDNWLASFRVCDQITKAAYIGFQEAKKKTHKLTQELLRYEKIRLHVCEETKSLEEMKEQTTRERKIYREVEIQDKNTHAMMYNLLTLADMQSRVFGAQQAQRRGKK